MFLVTTNVERRKITLWTHVNFNFRVHYNFMYCIGVICKPKSNKNITIVCFHAEITMVINFLSANGDDTLVYQCKSCVIYSDIVQGSGYVRDILVYNRTGAGWWLMALHGAGGPGHCCDEGFTLRLFLTNTTFVWPVVSYQRHQLRIILPLDPLGWSVCSLMMVKYETYLSSYASDLTCRDTPSIRTAVRSDFLSEFEVHFSANKKGGITSAYNVHYYCDYISLKLQ